MIPFFTIVTAFASTARKPLAARTAQKRVVCLPVVTEPGPPGSGARQALCLRAVIRTYSADGVLTAHSVTGSESCAFDT